MKSNLFKLIITSVVCMTAISFQASVCAAGSQTNHNAAITVSAAQTGGGTFYVGQSVFDLLNAADKNGVKLNFNAQYSTYSLDDSDNFSVDVSDGYVTDINNFIFNNADGLKLGDSLDSILRMYGKLIAYQFNDSEMFLYDIDGVYMDVESTNQSGPAAAKPPVIAGIRYCSLGNPILSDFFSIYKDDSDTSAPLGNGTSLVNYGLYLYCLYPTNDKFGSNRLVRIDKATGEEKVLSESCSPSVYSRIYCDARRIYYTSIDSNGNPFVCSMALDGTDIIQYCAGELVYFNNNPGVMYILDAGGKGELLKTNPYGEGDISVVNADICNFICADTYHGAFYSATDTNNIYLHYLNNSNNKDIVIAQFPIDINTDYYYEFTDAEIFGDKLYYAYGAHQGTGANWSGDIWASALDGSSTKCLVKDAADKFIIFGKDLYYTTNYEYSAVSPNLYYYLGQDTSPVNAKMDLFSEESVPSDIDAFDTYDGDRSVYYFDNSMETTLMLTAKTINSDPYPAGALIITTLDRTVDSDITQAINNISVSGNWVYFEVSNVDYTVGPWYGDVKPSQFYVVKKDGTGLRLLNADDATFTPYSEEYNPSAAPAASQPVTVTAQPTSSSVLINGKNVTFDAYNINGSNYFKLRDLAYALNGSAKQFDVGWDAANNAVSLTSGKPYTVAGSEMAGGSVGNKTTIPTNSNIYLNGESVSFTAYNIGGNNYFKLRDIGLLFNFGVGWDAATSTITIDTSKDYTA